MDGGHVFIAEHLKVTPEDTEETRETKRRIEMGWDELSVEFRRLQTECDRSIARDAECKDLKTCLQQVKDDVHTERSARLAGEARLLRLEIEMESQREERQREKESAVLRQLALDIERIFRQLLWSEMSEDMRGRFYFPGTRVIDRSAVATFDYRACFTDDVGLFTKILDRYFNGDNTQYAEFLDMLYNLKEFSRNGAHPKHLNREPLTYTRIMRCILNASFLTEADVRAARTYTAWVYPRP